VLRESAEARGSQLPPRPPRKSTGRASGASPTARKQPSARSMWAALVTSRSGPSPRSRTSVAV
jgi:hypothetical protein